MKTFACPECTKGGQHDPNHELERIFWHFRQRCADHRPGEDHQYPGDSCSNGCRTNATGIAARAGNRATAKGDHDEGDFKTFKEH